MENLTQQYYRSETKFESYSRQEQISHLTIISKSSIYSNAKHETKHNLLFIPILNIADLYDNIMELTFDLRLNSDKNLPLRFIHRLTINISLNGKYANLWRK